MGVARSFPASGGTRPSQYPCVGRCLGASLHSIGHRFSWVSLFTRRSLGGENPAPGCPGLWTGQGGVLCHPARDAEPRAAVLPQIWPCGRR